MEAAGDPAFNGIMYSITIVVIAFAMGWIISKLWRR